MDLPEPDLPGDFESWQNLFTTFLVKCKHHHDLLQPNQAEQLFERFLREPGTLRADDMALVLSILALGQEVESQLRPDDPNSIEEGVAFYRLAMTALESCDQASQTGIRGSKTLQEEGCHWISADKFLRSITHAPSFRYLNRRPERGHKSSGRHVATVSQPRRTPYFDCEAFSSTRADQPAILPHNV